MGRKISRKGGMSKTKTVNAKPSLSDESALTQLTDKINDNLVTSEKGNYTTNSRKRKTDTIGSNSTSSLKSSSPPSKRQKKPSPKIAPSKPTREDLLREIKSLGGDEKDLDLIGGVDSDIDTDSLPLDSQRKNSTTDVVSEDLMGELRQFAAALGLEQSRPLDEPDAAEIDESDGDQEIDILKSVSKKEEKKKRQDAALEKQNNADVTVNVKERDIEGEAAAHSALKSLEKVDMKASNSGSLLFEPCAEWHAADLPPLPALRQEESVDTYFSAVESLYQHAKWLLQTDANTYANSVMAASSHKFIATIMSSGTTPDKVSALTLAIQESPIHNIRAFSSLLSLASKKSRSQAVIALGAIIDLLGPGFLLPSNRRLRPFRQQPGLIAVLQHAKITSWSVNKPLPSPLSPAHLISWAFEDWLKETYFGIVQLLEVWISDEIDYSRIRALDFVYGLLREKPEQEANLLKLLVNKLGDLDRKLASRTSHLLLQLQTSHPGMKLIIIRAIETEILLRPSQSIKTRYYAVNTLNQTILSAKETKLVDTLIRIYFDLFMQLLKTEEFDNPSQSTDASSEGRPKHKGDKNRPNVKNSQSEESSEKLATAILTGINRAIPYVEHNDEMLQSQINTLFRVAHSRNFNTSVQALTLIQQMCASRNIMADRYYRVLYESLLDARLATTSKQAIYLNLLLRSLKSDLDLRRVKAFVKRMLQVLVFHQPSFATGILYIVLQLCRVFPDLHTLIEVPEDGNNDGNNDGENVIYDGKKRDPEYSNAQRSCLWEILPLMQYYHPAAQMFAEAIYEKSYKVALTQKPELESHTLIRFLDKFVFRNPKTKTNIKGNSIMQPLLAKPDMENMWLRSQSSVSGLTQVNSGGFWNKKQDDVPVEDIFFHEYFHKVGKASGSRKGAKSLPKDGGELEEDEVWKALVSSTGPVDEAPDDESDLDMYNYSESDEDDGGVTNRDIDDEADEDTAFDDGVELNLDSDASDEDGDEEDDIATTDKKLTVPPSKPGRLRRRELKALPTFASADDYAELLSQQDHEDS